jgi:cytochrome c biogenesis protein
MKKIFDDIVAYLSSVRFTLVILIAIAAVAAVGTFVGQNREPMEYVLRFGHVAYRVLELLSVTDIYHSPYFNALLMLLCANITLCTIALVPKRVRGLFIPETERPSYPHSESFVTRRPEDEAARIVRRAVRSILRRTTVRHHEGATTIVSTPHPLFGLGPIIVHLSILLIIVGGLISSLFGFSGDMDIIEGGMSNEVAVKKGYSLILDFSVRLDRFTFERYKDGTPKEYRSDVTFLDGKKEVPATISVNRPAIYRGIRFYQMSFGKTMDYATIEVLDRGAERVFTGDAHPAETVPVPGRNLTLTIVEYAPDFLDLGPAVHLVVDEGGKQYDLWTFVNYPDFDAERGGDYVFVLKEYHEVPYSGITAVREPGLVLVFSGFILICVGFLFPLSRSMGAFMIRIAGRAEKTRVTVSGAPGRLAGGFKERFEHRARTIKERLC